MHDINFIRDNPIAFDNAMKKRGEIPISKKIIELDENKRKTQTILQKNLSEKNLLSKSIGDIKSKRGDASKEFKRVEEINSEISTLKELEIIQNDELNAILTRLPNIPDDTTPSGKS